MNKKKFNFSILKKISAVIVMASALISVSYSECMANELKSASPTSSKIYVDGCETYIQGYNVEFNNYFKLRDLAAALSSTNCKFKVSYDGNYDIISITTGEGPENNYTLVDENPSIQPASYTQSKIFIDGTEVNPVGYNIKFNNYFKLRDLGELLGFNVEWSEKWNSIYITTDNGGDIDYNSYRREIEYFDELNQVVYLVNCEREKYGLPPLKWDLNITKAAIKRSAEIVDVFSHTRPDGSSCFTVFKEFNIDYMTAGENIAIGQSTPESVVSGWMNSQGHRENILSGSFGKIGIGAVKVQSGPYRGFAWTQLFTN